MRIGVIGAGIAGICSAKHAIQNGLEVVVFEQTDQIGGTWVYTEQIGKDEYGIDIHSSMYKDLYTNLPKETMGFLDFAIPEQERSYVPSEDVVSFLNLYADTFNVKSHILFRHHVVSVVPVHNKWQVTVKDLRKNTITKFIFDYIMVCNGHYHTPIIPDLPGKSTFHGKQLHSRHFKRTDTYKGESILIIGAGPSGVDLTCSLSKVAERISLSQHLKRKFQNVFPSNVHIRPDVSRMLEDGVEFVDGTRETFTVILYCTGFEYKFPFLSDKCGIFVEENFVQPLYKHCININNPTMALIGLPFQVCATLMIDMQVNFVMKYFSGKKQLPSKGEMIADTEKEMQTRCKNGLRKKEAHRMGPDQERYYRDLSETAEIENVKPVMIKMHNRNIQNMCHDVFNFRKVIFKIVDDENFIEIK